MDPLSASIVNAATASTQLQLADQVQTSVLKKALDIEASAALALVQSLPSASAASGLGTLVDVYA